MPRSLAPLGLVSILWLSLLSGCADPPSLPEHLAAHYEAREHIATWEPISLQEAMVLQASFVAQLETTQGTVIGYKAGLTSADAQARFNMEHPVRGTLLEHMLLPSGSTVPATFGARPLFEGDLMVRVGSAGINEAETDSALYASLNALIPFLELPDLLFHPDVTVDGPALAAINVGARLGIQGELIPLPADSTGIAQLAAIRVELRNSEGDLLGEGHSSQLLDHPLNVVRWIRDTLREEGKTLTPGMLLSLGSMTPLFPVEAGMTVTARYSGLPAAESVDITVSFE